jgi:hypothetical protein
VPIVIAGEIFFSLVFIFIFAMLALMVISVLFMPDRIQTRIRQQFSKAKMSDKEKLIKEKRYHMGARLSKPVNWRVLLSREIQRHLPDQKTEAIIRYRQLTGADVQDATQTIAYHIAYPNHVPAHFVHYELTDEQIASLHRLLRRGKRDDAHRRYQEMTGIDQFAADIGLDILEQQLSIEDEQFAVLRDIADTDVDEIQEHPVSQRERKG